MVLGQKLDRFSGSKNLRKISWATWRLLVNAESWQKFCAEVTREMLHHVKPFVSPISKILSDEHGEHLGSGSCVGEQNARFLVTNEHVARNAQSAPLAHQFLDADAVLRAC